MVATENSLRKILSILALAAVAAGPGCSPSGSRALLQGDALLREGKAAEAVKKLERAKAAMPEEPRVWNVLGLAYHRAGQPQLAAQAYQLALAKDKSNLVSVAHYNFGCLLLEQNNLAAAVDHLRSFTLTTNSAAGLVKLATAQFRLRRLDLAEATFGAALRLEPKNVEALNGVGVIHAQKNQRDAGQYFQAALQWNPKYAPALLNTALLGQQNPATRGAALQRFRDYLAAAPASPHGETVKALVRQIEIEFAQQAAASNALVNAALKSNALVAALRATNLPATSAPPKISPVVTNTKPPVLAVKTNAPLPAKTNEVAVANPAPAAPSNPPITLVSVTSAPAPRIASPQPTVVRPTPTPPPVVTPTTSSVAVMTPDFTPSALPPEKKPGLFKRLNPFRNKPKAPETNEAARVVMRAPPTNASVPAAKPVFARYKFLSPSVPAGGNRNDAERATTQAMKAERAANTNEAWLNYHLAIAADPTYFEAQYNAALLAYRLGDSKRALGGFETALVLKPESIDTRYNFALALKQAGHAHDAVAELQRILEAKPNEVRAHLTLGNLYAQQFNEPAAARTHYAKVLELEPRNPQAAVIRFWLAANP